MATTIKLKNGSGAPLAGDLVAGEPALDLTNKRLYTEDSGGTVIEVGTNPGTDVTFADNRKAIFGAGNDLQIYHSGSHSFIADAGTGDLYIGASNNIALMNAAFSENKLLATTDGALNLYYDGSQKLATTATGIDVTGDVNSDSVTTGTFTSTGIDDNATSTAITIDSSENVGIGTASPQELLHLRKDASAVVAVKAQNNTTNGIMEYQAGNDADNWFFGIDASDNFGISDVTGQASQRLVITQAGNVGIGTTSPTEKLSVIGNLLLNNAFGDVGIKLGPTGVEAYIGYVGASGNLEITPRSGYNTVFNTGGTERMRIDSSGNLLVGKTSDDITVVGCQLNATGAVLGTRASASAMSLNRTGTDGDIADFRKNGTTVGSIGNLTSSSLYINGNGSAVADLGFGGTSLIYPTVDNVADLGIATFRFDDIYATNGTIQTSDANEKQDIEALSEAEQRVAVAAKGLLRKFRWKSAVEEKGDDARIHFGIIAQDLQAAFEAEGLDAGRYGMFIHSTWTDEETGEERSRMGVRYSELLAFIIAAI